MSGLVAVIDYGMGNLHSVASALHHVGADEVVVTHDAELIRKADRVVFPGVGAIRDCMGEIKRLQCDELLTQALTEQRVPVLAICVGLQAMMSCSQENGGVDCLDIIPGEVRYFGNPLSDAEGNRLKVPHMGWNAVCQKRQHPLWQGIADMTRFYFVHSYYVHAEDRSLLAASVEYGVSADAALARDNLFAVQFHPEKSAGAGLQLLRNFIGWNGTC
ncbi:imidazole glycerol phosphate synthase subunit HisH [Candidatus Marimicrobium litorale]|jgi:glutamine amidotransferase|uniref:Imidazole glycerol phosphate synthase subunit HisH n=1 Tax=Candidatus Marimicrobium litorale TaxID=2518991 RepID=A0ABT3T7T4_9GAMM|nr:imidazole glycerol phosphate synthase subunit HisH [Candidatus Marimicrobium litorale]MCX2978326.1 imidazole glycerol phosphate synthase subunit HisH [Candidatus Marimicrobium litorale]